MNMRSDTTRLDVSKSGLTLSIDSVGLLELSSRELLDTHGVLLHLEDGLCAFLSQPRFAKPSTDAHIHDLNKAGALLNTLYGFMSHMRSALQAASEGAATKSAEEIEDRAWMALEASIFLRDDLSDIAADAASRSADYTRALVAKRAA